MADYPDHEKGKGTWTHIICASEPKTVGFLCCNLLQSGLKSLQIYSLFVRTTHRWSRFQSVWLRFLRSRLWCALSEQWCQVVRQTLPWDQLTLFSQFWNTRFVLPAVSFPWELEHTQASWRHRLELQLWIPATRSNLLSCRAYTLRPSLFHLNPIFGIMEWNVHAIELLILRFNMVKKKLYTGDYTYRNIIPS